MRYADFLARKAIIDPPTGIEPGALPTALFPFQRDIVKWALRRGRAALFAGTGLGKSLMELSWAQAVHGATGKDILHLAPLAVSNQMAREAEKFGIVARVVTSADDCAPGINITNYQKLQHFDLSAFGGVILDESSILKSTDGHYRTRLIDACQSIPFRLAATATPAPNDFMELGNHAEFLGVMSYTDMLATFFTHDGGDTQKWRLKGHAENEFWKWMASWAVMLRKPSDLGYSNDGYDLPPLHFAQHVVGVDYAPCVDTGLLFPMQAETLQERIAARRATVEQRCELAVSVVLGGLNAKSVECEHQSKTANICAPTMPPTKAAGSAAENNKTRSTEGVASAMQPMQSSPNNADEPLKVDVSKAAKTAGSEHSSESRSVSTTKSCEDRAEAAQSAVQDATASQGDNSASITATIQASSEASCAATAISPLGCSETGETCSPERSNISTKPEPWVIWCHLNSEQDYLKRRLGDLAISIHGGQDDETKERLHQDWLAGKAPVLIVKPSMFGHGLNWQHCHQTVFVGLNDSWEQYYQAVRRFWRFGQIKDVTCHIIASEIEGATVANIRRKEADAERMAASMVLHMADLSSQAVRGSVRDTPNYNPQQPVQLPAFLEVA